MYEQGLAKWFPHRTGTVAINWTCTTNLMLHILAERITIKKIL